MKIKSIFLIAITMLMFFAASASSVSGLAANTQPAMSSLATDQEDDTKPLNAYISAAIDADGNAYIPTMDGNVITIDNCKKAYLTEDRDTVVVIQKDGTIYYTDPALTEKHIVTKAGVLVEQLRNSGFIYKDEEGKLYRVDFETGSIFEYGKVRYIFTARDTLSSMYIPDQPDGELFILADDLNNSKNIPNSKNSYLSYAGESTCGITNEGDIFTWCDADNILYLYENGENTEIGAYHVNTIITYAQKLIVFEMYSSKLWIKNPGENIKSIDLKPEKSIGTIYTGNGRLADNNYFYVSAGNSIYSISYSGDANKIISGVDWASWSIAENSICYIDEVGSLYYAELNGVSIENKKKICDDVLSFKMSYNGEYIYYYSAAKLWYAYSIKDNIPVLISDNDSLGYLLEEEMGITTDGETIFYFRDINCISNGSDECSPNIYYGTLVKWDYHSKKEEIISTSAILKSCSSGLELNYDGYIPLYTLYLDAEGIAYLEYVSGNTDCEKDRLDLMYYNGRTSSKLASDIVNFQIIPNCFSLTSNFYWGTRDEYLEGEYFAG